MSSTVDEIIALVVELALAGSGVVVSGALAYATMKTWNILESTQASLCKISQVKTVPISDLRSLIASSTSSKSESSKEMLVIVRGITKPNSSSSPDVLVSQISGEKCLVLEQTWTSLSSTMCANLLFGKKSDYTKNTPLSKIPFILSSGSGKGQGSDHVIVNLEGSSHSLPLTLIFNRLHNKNSDICPPVRYTKHRELLAEEKILPIGKEITVVGTCSLQDGNPQIKACKELPYFLSDLTRDEIVQQLTDRRMMLVWGSIFLGSLSLTALLYASHLLKKWRQHQRNRNR